jgi:SIR2-like domain
VRGASPALITFNYDLVLERTLWDYFHCYGHAQNKPHVASCAVKYHFGACDFALKGGLPHTYGTTRGQRAEFCWENKAEIEIPYLKLHGSLNWEKKGPTRSRTESGEMIRPLSFPTMVVEQPLILPPVFNKMNSSAVNGVWKTALEVLRHAKNIIIVGYSLPKTDIYMQYFLKSAVGPNSSLQRIIVFDPILFQEGQSSNEMKQRYLECFSPQFSGRITRPFLSP